MGTSYFSGTDTQLIPSGRVKYADGSFVDTRIFDRVTQNAHGFTGRVPVYFNTSTNLWALAKSDAATTLATHVARVVNSNTLDIILSGTAIDTSHGLTTGQYYFVSDATAGTLTTTEPTAVGSFSNPVIYVTTANNYIVLNYRPSQTVNQSFNPLLNDGTAAAPSLAFSADTDTGIFRPGANQFGIATDGAERFRIEATGQIKAVYESTVGTNYNTTLHNGYLCRAWVNFNGTGSVAIRASGNVSSITDNGTGDYTANFTTAMPDANYAVSIGSVNSGFTGFNFRGAFLHSSTPIATNNCRICYGYVNGGATDAQDADPLTVAVFR